MSPGNWLINDEKLPLEDTQTQINDISKKKFNFKHDEPDPVEKSFMNNFFIFNNDFIVWEGIRMKIEVLCNFRLDPVSVPRTLVAVSPSSSVRVRAGGGSGSGSVEPAGTLTLSLSTQQTKPNPAMAACM